jgi:hypothetical protein
MAASPLSFGRLSHLNGSAPSTSSLLQPTSDINNGHSSSDTGDVKNSFVALRLATELGGEESMDSHLAKAYRSGEFADLTLHIALVRSLFRAAQAARTGSPKVEPAAELIIFRNLFFFLKARWIYHSLRPTLRYYRSITLSSFIVRFSFWQRDQKTERDIKFSLRTAPREPRVSPVVRGLELFDANITVEALNLCLCYLYSPISIRIHITPGNVKGVFATAYYLQLHALSNYCCAEVASGSLKELRDAEAFASWFNFLDVGSRMMARSSQMNSSNGGSTGANSPSLDLTGLVVEIPYGQLGKRLNDELMTRLIEHLPRELLATPDSKGKGAIASANGLKTLIDILASVPFNIFKSALESSSFPMISDQDRVGHFVVLSCLIVLMRGLLILDSSH